MAESFDIRIVDTSRGREDIAAYRRSTRIASRVMSACVSMACVVLLSGFSPPSKITVVTDFNYPPYLFKTESEELRGIIKDKWERWSNKTGIPVEIVGMNWVEAQQAVQDGTFDVIETLSYTEARTQQYEYSPAYAPVEAYVYFHYSMSGINDVASLRDFTVGAKDGSACGNWLSERGVDSISRYPTSESLIRAASHGEVRLFCMDSITAQYYLYKLNIADEFRHSPALYTTQFHWAVKKGRTELRDFIQRGFERFTPEELADIDARWIGNPLRFPLSSRYWYYLALLATVVFVIFAVLILWNRGLRARIFARTAELQNALLWRRQAVSAGNVGLFDWDIHTNRVHYSLEWKKQIGYADHEIGDGFNEWHERVHPDDIERTSSTVRAYIDHPQPEYRDEFRFRHKDGSYRWILVQASLQLDPRGKPTRMLGSHVDITERKQREALLQGQAQVLELIASGASLEKSLDALLRIIEAHFDEMLCSILLLDADGTHVRHGAAPSLPASFTSAIDGAPVGEYAGSCGTAAFRRDAVIVEDIASDPLWRDYRDLASQHGLRACWSTPIFDEQRRVLGTFALYFRTPGRPAEKHVRLIDVATHTAAIAISRQREHEALRRNEDERARLVCDLGQRVKELTLLHRFARLLQGARPFNRDLLVELVALLPSGWQFPQICQARIAYGGRSARTPGWHETPWQQRAQFTTGDGQVGVIEVVYLEACPDAADGPFLKEERDLIESLADMLAAYLERGRIEAALRSSAAQFRAMFENAAIGIALVDPEGRLAKCNPALTRMLGYSDIELSRLRFTEFTYPDDVEVDLQLYRSVLAEERDYYQIEKRYIRKDGQIVWGRLMVSLLSREEEDKPRFVVNMVEDITERKGHEERIQYLATHDALTDLPNRILLGDRLLQAVAHARRSGRQFALLFVDLDGFKHVNDSFGHDFGDDLLRVVAGRLTEVVGASDTIARQGGDEFIVLLSDLVQPEDAATVVTKLLDALARPFVVGEREIYLSASIGVCVYPDNGEDLPTLLRNADTALYLAKEEGGNVFRFYSREMGERVRERVEIDGALHRALEREEFLLHYQPRVELDSERIVGVEALIRWQRPQIGLVSPDKFIPVAEQTGLIVPIGEWVLRTACTEARSWRKADLSPLDVSVNLSVRQLRSETLTQRIVDVCREVDFDLRRLELELTEGMVMRNAEMSLGILQRLNELGIQLAIDDFGTGYSSLGYLKRFPFDRLKIDKSFVHDVGVDADDEAIVRSMISLGHSLGLKVVAEGIETPMQLEFLRANGCDEGQGYLFSRPLPAADFAALLGQGAMPAGAQGKRRAVKKRKVG